ncbi:hypothetical protein TDIS_0391 [Thermosulfurimonas dismutans]|uniref:Uncharacterized protein n=1 Tax=Thermosulfurimonas dismutans TaxID=999894 RepID=A0A179D7D6_9BACT|nr:hypothetical protein TDIS_0391 [Thermosulfurimonas dismutans]
MICLGLSRIVGLIRWVKGESENIQTKPKNTAGVLWGHKLPEETIKRV